MCKGQRRGLKERLGERPRGSNPSSSQPCFASHHPGGTFCTSQVQQPGSVCRCPTWEGRVGQVLPRVLWVPEGPGGGSPPLHPKLNTTLCLCLHSLCQSVLSPTATGGSGVFNMCTDAFQPSGDGLALIQKALGYQFYSSWLLSAPSSSCLSFGGEAKTTCDSQVGFVWLVQCVLFTALEIHIQRPKSSFTIAAWD